MEDKDASTIQIAKAQSQTPSDAWNKIPWGNLEEHVFSIQKRIYQASLKSDRKTVQECQKLLTKSRAARFLAVRRVTQDNSGKKTAGVDGIKALSPTKRIRMAEAIHPKYWRAYKPRPVRRVWIEKAGKPEKRPLGIPTMQDRALQALVKLALEPEWEAKFEANSYGFRPGRSAHDAIEHIFKAIVYKPKYVFDADIKGCFDNINQEKLIHKVNTYPAIRRLIKDWLKAGVVDKHVFTSTDKGVSQGSILGPLLANIALDGLQGAVTEGYKYWDENPTLIRFADDFIILYSDRVKLEKTIQIATIRLQQQGLWLNQEKTRIAHTLNKVNKTCGFDFLGFGIKQIPVGKTHTGKQNGKSLGYKTLIQPSKKAIKEHTRDLKETVKEYKNASQEVLINHLSPKIIGWTNYFRTVVSSDAFKTCDRILFSQLYRWAISRHPKKGKQWIKAKYWHTIGSNHWIFATKSGTTLIQHQSAKIQRHIKVKGSASPYDGNNIYWSIRLRNYPMMRTRTRTLLKLQQGKCAICKLFFRDGNRLEIDHIKSRKDGGSNELSNLRLLHRHCHDQRYHTKPETSINNN